MSFSEQLKAAPVINDTPKSTQPITFGNKLKQAPVLNTKNVNLTASVKPTDYLSQYDTGLTPMITDVEQFRAGKQSGLAQFTNAVAGGIASGLVGVGENFSVLADAVGSKLGLMEDFEKSFLTENLQNAKDYINELTPIYRKERSDSFDWDDSGFYFEMLKGAVDSAVAFGIAGAGYAGVMRSLASTLGKITLAGQRLNVLTRFAGSKLGNPLIAQDLTQLGAAALSNYAEGTIMGLETYETEKEKLMDVGIRNKVMEVAAARGISPDEVVLTEDELHSVEAYAIKEAANAGHMMRNLNHMLIFSNIAQMNSIAGLRKFIGAGGSTATRNMVKKAGIKEFWKGQAMGAPLEGSEEILQNVIQKESKYQSDLSAQASGLNFLEGEMESSTTGLGARLLEFATSDQALLEGMMGFISGPIQYGLTQAPFQKGVAAEQNKRYAMQQTLIGQNAEFIKNKLKQTATGEDLAKEFEAYRDEVLGRDPSTDTEELRAQDMERFEKLIANTELDTLIQENFFQGTTQDLEDQLTEQANKQVTNEEDQLLVDNAKKALERLNVLETRFNNYNKYINGAEIFAADLRGERLGEIASQLEESFTNREKQMTMDIQAAIENEYVKLYGDAFDGELSNLSENFILKSVDKNGNTIEGLDKQVNSVTDIVEGIKKGYTLFSSKTGGKALGSLDVVNKALMNKMLLDETKKLQRANRLFVNNAKSLDYQTLYTNFTDAMQSVDENNVNDMGLVKTNLEELLKDKRFTKEEFKQLKTSIELQIADIDKKIRHIEATDASVSEDTKEEVKTKSKEAEKEKKKKHSILDADPEEELPVTTTEETASTTPPATPSDKVYKPFSPEITAEFQKPMEQRNERFKNGKFINPDTGKAERLHSLIEHPSNPNMWVASFESNPTKFYNFMDTDPDGDRYIPSEKEFNQTGTTTSTPTPTTPKYKVGDTIDYNGEKGFKITAVLPNGNLKIKKNNRVVEINPAKPTNTITKAADSSTQQKATTKQTTSKTPANQVDNKKATKTPIDPKKVNLDEVEPVAVDNGASVQSMRTDVQKQDTFETPNEVDVIAVTDPKTGKVTYQSANVKTLDYNFNDGNNDEFAQFVRNKQNKEGVPVLMSIDTTSRGVSIFPGKTQQVKEAIAIFNKLKEAGVKDLKNWNKHITAEEYETLVNFLPVKFNVKANQAIQSYTQVKGKFNLKTAERILREDTITASLQGKSLERLLKGQGPGRLNEIQPTKVDAFLNDDTKVNNAILHVSVGGALVALNEEHEDMFDETFMGYTDGTNNTEGWDGVFTIAVKNLAGKMFPVKLNTLNHNRNSAQIVSSLIADLINPKYKTAKGDVDNNVQNAKLKDINPTVHTWFKNNIPSIFKVYGDNITVGQALSDMIYYGNKTKDTFGHLSIGNGLVSIGGGVNTKYSKKGKPLQFNFADLQNPETGKILIDFIEEVKPYNVQASKLKGKGVNRTAYRQHVFGNYMESSVDLSNPFTKVTAANPDGNPVQRYQRAHLYISALAPGQTAEQGTITQTEPVPAPPADLFAPTTPEPKTTKYKGITVQEGEFKNKTGEIGGAKYVRAENKIYINDKVLEQKYKEKAWTKPYEQTDGSKAEPLAENAFTSYEQFRNFVLEHEYQHTVTSREEYNKIMPWANTIGNYEDFINQKAGEALGIDIHNNTPKEPVKKVQTSSNIKPAPKIESVTLSVITLKEILDFDMYARIYGVRNFLDRPRTKILDHIKQKEAAALAEGASETAKKQYESALKDLENYDKALKLQEGQNPFNQSPNLEKPKESTNLQETKEAETMQQKTEEELNKCNIPAAKATGKAPSLKSALNKNRRKK